MPEIITRGHICEAEANIVDHPTGSGNKKRIDLIEKRAVHSNYLILPTKFTHTKTVKIYGYVILFIIKCRRKAKVPFSGSLLYEGVLQFDVFQVQHAVGSEEEEFQLRLTEERTVGEINLCHFFHASLRVSPDHTTVDRCMNLALLYLFRKASGEVREFNSVGYIKKHMIEQEDILLSRNRMTTGLDYVHTGELNINLGSLGIKVQAPVIDRFSPLAYSIGQHVHWKLAPHRGVETQNRISLEHVSIIQSMSLFKELSEECIRCRMRRKKLLEAKMGPIKPEQVTIAPPFWACLIDLFGPYQVYVPGFERQTRNRKVLDCQAWILAVVCPTTILVNLQVVEKNGCWRYR